MTPIELDEFETLTANSNATLQPVGILEQTYATEIAGAGWRLLQFTRREAALTEAALTEATLTTAAPAESTEPDLDALHRARANALNIMSKATRELRLLQTERQVRNEIFPEGTDISHLGVAIYAEVIAARATKERARLLAEKADEVERTKSFVGRPDQRRSPATPKTVAPKTPAAETVSSEAAPSENRPSENMASFCKTPPQPAAPAPSVARNSLCPCKSGQKFKRCCGVNAPPVLGKAA